MLELGQRQLFWESVPPFADVVGSDVNPPDTPHSKQQHHLLRVGLFIVSERVQVQACSQQELVGVGSAVG